MTARAVLDRRAAYMREWRWRNDPRPEPVLVPCGTRSAYRRHRRRSEPPCEACRAANAEYTRAYRASKPVNPVSAPDSAR